jgi:hypothetical protein
LLKKGGLVLSIYSTERAGAASKFLLGAASKQCGYAPLLKIFSLLLRQSEDILTNIISRVPEPAGAHDVK